MAVSQEHAFSNWLALGRSLLSLAFLLVLLSRPISASGQSITVAWDPPEVADGVGGYYAYLISEKGETRITDVGLATTYSFVPASPGLRYLIYVTTYDYARLQSKPSFVMQYPDSSECFAVNTLSTTRLPAGRSLGSFFVTAATGCSGLVSSDASWLSVTNSVEVGGRILVTFVAASNNETDVRSALLNIGSTTTTLVQAGGPPPPVIVRPIFLPDPVFAEGARLELSIELDDNSDAHFQWWKDDAAISGATNAAFRIESLSSENSGGYSVTVSNRVGIAQDGPLVITVIDRPRIILQPVGIVSPGFGDYYTQFSVSAIGTNLDFIWLKDGAAVTNGITRITDEKATITVGPITNYNVLGNYQVIVSNPGGSVLSQPALLSTPDYERVLGIIRVSLLADSNIRVRGQGIPGETYDIQVSRDLVEWSTYSSVTVPVAGFFIIESPRPADDPAGQWYVRTFRQPRPD
jgi:hypothetical protein